MMKEINFQVKGSEPDPYNVTICLDSKNLKCTCSCRAGRTHKYCKHWQGIFDEQFKDPKSDYIGLSESQINEARSWLQGSDLEELWNEYAGVAKEYKKLQEEKKKVAKKLKNFFSKI